MADLPWSGGGPGEAGESASGKPVAPRRHGGASRGAGGAVWWHARAPSLKRTAPAVPCWALATAAVVCSMCLGMPSGVCTPQCPWRPPGKWSVDS